MPRGKERIVVYVVTLDAQGRRVVRAVPQGELRNTAKTCA